MNHLVTISIRVIDPLAALYLPISDPTPRGLPLNEMSADSPPELPPHVVFLFLGLRVRPNTLLTVSAIIIAVGTFVLT